MIGRRTPASAEPGRAFEPGHSLPMFDRLAPAPPPAVVAARIDLHTGPGDVVVDLAGRGGWIARAAVDRQRRAVSLESSPLTRMLAEVVLRPPDVRHLDAAFQAMAASPRPEASLRTSIGDLYATRCATCGRALIADEFTWSVGPDLDGEADPDAHRGIAATARPVLRHYRCTVCRDQLGGGEMRQAPLDAEDLRRATAHIGADAARAKIGARFPKVPGAERLVDDMLDLHTPRQLVALAAILERIEGELRAAPLLAALRLALLHTILPASRLASGPGRVPSIRMAAGHVRLAHTTEFRERNPWFAFEEAFRAVRGFVQRLDSGPFGPVQARLGEDLHALGEGNATAALGLAGASRLLAVHDRTYSVGRSVATPRVRLVIGQPPMRPNLDRLAAMYHATSWVLGREAAALLPLEGLAETSLRPSWGWQAAAVGRFLEAVAPAMARDGRVVQLAEPGPEPLVAAVLGGSSAGYRLLDVRRGDTDSTDATDTDAPWTVELLPPGGLLPPGPRTRANVALDPVPGGAGDPDVVTGRGLFRPPERVADRPFSVADTARTVTATAVETLLARGEPAPFDQLLGEILVGLDRAGQLRRLADASFPQTDANTNANANGGRPLSPADPHAPTEVVQRHELARAASEIASRANRSSLRRTAADREAEVGVVERLIGLIRDELGSSTQRRVTEIEPGRWWLRHPDDIAAAAVPLADRVEWAVFSLLSTAGPLTETAFLDRIGAMFTGHDLPESGLVGACLDSYRSATSTSDRLMTDDELLGRSQEHTDLLGLIAEAGHRLGMRVWIGRREQARRYRSGTLGDLLGPSEDRPSLGRIARAGDALAEVDAIWYVRGKIGFLFEVEWTAMLGEPLLRRHAQIPAGDDLIRFLVIAPERTELVRYKIARSPLLRRAMSAGTWHVIKADHLRTFLARDPLELGALEPYLGLDPAIEREHEQMPLFG
jgi:hypothetical protein